MKYPAMQCGTAASPLRFALVPRAWPSRPFSWCTQSRGGFTLIELIITLSIVVIVIGMAASFMMFGTNFLANTQTKEEDKQLTDRGADYIKERLLFASDVQIIYADHPPTQATGGAVLYVGTNDGADIASAGEIYYLPEGATVPVNVLGGGFYRERSFAFEYQAKVEPGGLSETIPAKSFALVAQTLRDGAVVYENTKTFSFYDVAVNSSPTHNESAATSDVNFYLLIGVKTQGYVQDGLLLHLDAINNAGLGDDAQAANATVWRDLSGNGNDFVLTLTDNTTPWRERSLYLDGAGDYVRSHTNNVILDENKVTVEVCFRPGTTENRTMMLLEYSPDWNIYRPGFGIALNEISSTPTMNMVHTNLTPLTGSKPVNYAWITQNTMFTTHTNYFSMAAGDVPRAVWVDGISRELYKSGTVGESPGSVLDPYPTSQYFTSQYLYLGCRGEKAPLDKTPTAFFLGEIASVRIYNHKLTAVEVAQNAQQDYLRFGLY
jgi:prepilin-type N-terminal cleavage/methylation domain-containing protein